MLRATDPRITTFTEIDELDAFDEFLDSEAVMQKEDNPNPDAAKEDMDDDEEEDDD